MNDGGGGGGGTTSIQNNAVFGVEIEANSDVFLGVSTVNGNAALDIIVRDFSIANDDGALVSTLISCEVGQSSGTLC